MTVRETVTGIVSEKPGIGYAELIILSISNCDVHCSDWPEAIRQLVADHAIILMSVVLTSGDIKWFYFPITASFAFSTNFQLQPVRNVE